MFKNVSLVVPFLPLSPELNFHMLLWGSDSNSRWADGLLGCCGLFLLSDPETVDGDWDGCLPRPQQRHALRRWLRRKHQSVSATPGSVVFGYLILTPSLTIKP